MVRPARDVTYRRMKPVSQEPVGQGGCAQTLVGQVEGSYVMGGGGGVPERTIESAATRPICEHGAIWP